MTKTVEVTVDIKVDIDNEYSGAKHAEDIFLTTKRTFPCAQVKLLKIDIGCRSDAKLGEPTL